MRPFSRTLLAGLLLLTAGLVSAATTVGLTAPANVAQYSSRPLSREQSGMNKYADTVLSIAPETYDFSK